MRTKYLSRGILCGLAPLAVACAPGPGEDLELKLSNISLAKDGVGSSASVSSKKGGKEETIKLPEKETRITVETRAPGGAWSGISGVSANHQGPHRIEVMLIADNSGSEKDHEGDIRDAVAHFGAQLLQPAAEDRVGIVRVSTTPEVILTPTGDETAFDMAIPQLYVNNGWTALWDGMRMGVEALESSSLVARGKGGSDLCLDRTHYAIVGFTDGGDNNSADEQSTSHQGDGINTTPAMLSGMKVWNGHPVFHMVGVGRNIDDTNLTALAETSGGMYLPIDDMGRLRGALESTAARLRNELPFCFPRPSCDHTEGRVTIDTFIDGEPVQVSGEVALPACE